MTGAFFDLIQNIAILLIGYSLFVAIHIALVNFSQGHYRTHGFERIAGMVLLFSLGGLQLIHFAYLQHHLLLIHNLLYYILLFSVAPAFYLFSKPLLFADSHYRFGWGLHFLPILSTPFLPNSLAVPLAFIIGSGYLLWLAHSVYALRNQRNRFMLELWVLSAGFIIAVCVSLLGLGIFSLPEKWFIALYSTAIGSAFLLINIVLANSPQLSSEIVEAARETYAVSTLKQINCDEKLKQLNTLIEHDLIYQMPELDLPMLADKLAMSNHQLSELINIHLGKSFSRYIRECRVSEAKKQLASKPSISVLSIGLSVGFTSQSNFYSAFREIVGMTPGQFRKLRSSK